MYALVCVSVRNECCVRACATEWIGEWLSELVICVYASPGPWHVGYWGGEHYPAGEHEKEKRAHSASVLAGVPVVCVCVCVCARACNESVREYVGECARACVCMRACAFV